VSSRLISGVLFSCTYAWLVWRHQQQTSNIHSRSGVYKLTCPDCGKAFVGQTGRSFATRFKEHKNAFRTASHSPNFAKHLIEHTQSFGPIHSTMQILQLQNKGAHLNTIERFYIYAECTNNNHLNDDSTISPSKFFDTLLKPLQPQKTPHPPSTLGRPHEPITPTQTLLPILKQNDCKESTTQKEHYFHTQTRQSQKLRHSTVTVYQNSDLTSQYKITTVQQPHRKNTFLTRK
jgi:predicted RNA-binding Zn-ribbon protein involved in translation (DUF1610 family)